MFYDLFAHRDSSTDRRSGQYGVDALHSVRRRHRRANPVDMAHRGDETVDDGEPLALWLMKMTQSALADAMDHLTARPPESAGLLLGPTSDDLLITHFVPDSNGRGTATSFELGTAELNDLLKSLKPAGINCKGIVHNHPAGITSPSHGDLIYLRRVFGLPVNADTSQFFMPIVCGARFYPYVYTQGRVWHADLALI